MTRPPVPPDLVYFVRRGEVNDELRFSLRSVDANLPHERVWIAGHAPSWVRRATLLPGNRKFSKWENGPDNLRIACEALDGLAEWVTVMNDDFYVLRPTGELVPRVRALPLLHYAAQTRPGPWKESLKQTAALLASLGVEAPRSYEFHSPVAMRVDHLREAVRLIQADKPRRQPAQWRTVYGNLFGAEDWPDAVVSRDSKVRVRLRPDNDTGFESSDDSTFARVLRPVLAELFPERSEHEAAEYRRSRARDLGPQRRGVSPVPL